MGLEKLTNAFGILCLFQGLAAAIGAPIAGNVLTKHSIPQVSTKLHPTFP